MTFTASGLPFASHSRNASAVVKESSVTGANVSRSAAISIGSEPANRARRVQHRHLNYRRIRRAEDWQRHEQNHRRRCRQSQHPTLESDPVLSGLPVRRVFVSLWFAIVRARKQETPLPLPASHPREAAQPLPSARLPAAAQTPRAIPSRVPVTRPVPPTNPFPADRSRVPTAPCV